MRQVVRGVTLLDYTVGGPDFATDKFFTTGTSTNCVTGPTQPTCSPIWSLTGSTSVYYDIGGADEVHGESGDDTVYTGAGSDIVFGDAQDDDVIAGWGNDWISGGTGIDTLLGDDGRIFTSRNTGCTATSSAVCTELAEPLYGVYKLRRTDPNTRTSEGDVLNEFIYTPGQVQTSTINVAGKLAKAADLTIYNLGPNVDVGRNKVVDQPLYDANNSDDIIFGGWDDDFIHGGAGDDAISGSEALTSSFNPHFDGASTGSTGLDVIDWVHPYNPGDVLHFGADTNPWHSNHHVAQRLGEFYLYDEYDPRRTILFNADGTPWKGGAAPVTRQFFLNNDAALGHTVLACIAVDNQGNCTGTNPAMPTDGNDVIFGDLGNDWSRRRHRRRHHLGRLGQRPVERRRPAHHQRQPQRPAGRPELQLPGPGLRRRRPRHPDRQHRRRPAHRLGRRVQQLPRAVRALRDRHGQPPGRAAAARVPVRAVAQPGRRPDPRDRHRRRPGPQRRAGRRARPDHPARPRPVADADRRPDRPAGRQHPGRPPRHAARRGLQRRLGAGLRRGHRLVDRGPGQAAGGGVVARPGRGGRVVRRRLPADLLRDLGVDRHGQGDGRLEVQLVRHLRLLVADRFQVRRHRQRHQQDGDRPPQRQRLVVRRPGIGHRLAVARDASTRCSSR